MTTTIEITKAIIIKTSSVELLRLTTTLPKPIWPFEGKAVVNIECAAGRAEDWIKEHLPGIEYRVVDA